MLLAIDAGNSRVKWGWHDGRAWHGLATVSLIEFAAANHDALAAEVETMRAMLSVAPVSTRKSAWYFLFDA